QRVYGVSEAEARVAKGGRATEDDSGLVRCLLTAGAAVLTMTILVLLVLLFVAAEKAVAFDWSPPSPSLMGSFDRFALTTDHTLCAHAGKSVISLGGNAVDASVAAMFCLGATNPQSSGLGGGFLMTIFNATTGSCTAIDAREAAPSLATERMFINNSDGSKYGFLAAGVPGELAGYWEIFRRFGSGAVEWKELLQPTIDLIEGGVPVSAYLEEVMKVKERHFRLFPSMKLWINPATNHTYKEGEKMPRERLLKTLKRIAAAQDPVQLFYHGEFAEIIDREMKANGGIIRKEDLAAYKVRIHETPLVAHLKNGLAICGGPPPSGFAATQLIINIMSNLYPNSSVYELRHDAKVYHHLIEAHKFAYAQRTLMGDTSFVPSADQLSKRMLTPAFLASVLEKMTDHAHETAYYGGDNKAARADFGTSHVSVLDGEGNGVSATTTINRWFGAAVESEGLGILWNDEMDDFSTPGMANGFGFAPSETNFIAPGKRPMSSMSPLVVYDEREKKVRMVAGASGGSKIISALSKTVIRTLIFGETVKEAIDAPMLHNQFTPDISQTDQYFPLELKSMLESQFGQKFRNTTGFEGIVQAIHSNPEGKINACGDFRRKTDQKPAGA
ncbi:hypothetical protein PMAYCL1PPCAC_30226, partial [Pristionchus mayeri]